MHHPSRFDLHRESHLINRSNWLRAAILGANDGILSIASLMTGMAAAEADHRVILITGLAGLVAGATSMATGEYVSVSSQSDIEKADLHREKHELDKNPRFELEELTQIYIKRGLEPELAHEVARELTEHDALGAHARDELGISENNRANPLQAAFSSAASFTTGGMLPLLAAYISPDGWLIPVTIVMSLLALALLGIIGARTSGTAVRRPALRVLSWGALSLAFTAAIGHFFNTRP